jgi:pilus assembly protein CpaB
VKTRRVPLIIGLVLALGTGALVLGYLTSLRPSGSASATRPVLVATHDIPARAAATSDLFTVEQRIATQTDSDAISDPKALAGTYTLVAIPAGNVATTSEIGLASASTIPARLTVGMRAVSIPIDTVKGVAGLITPGDRVDVIAVPPHNGDELPRGYTIMRGVLVLAMGTDVATTTAGPPGPLGAAPPALSTATLELSPDQADRITAADINATLRLALRNPKESIAAFPTEPLKYAPQAAAAAANPAAPSAGGGAPGNATTTVTPSGVTVIDGDHISSGTTAPG